jgi:hypothetical protein
MFEAVTHRILGEDDWVMPREASERVASMVEQIQRWRT